MGEQTSSPRLSRTHVCICVCLDVPSHSSEGEENDRGTVFHPLPERGSHTHTHTGAHTKVHTRISLPALENSLRLFLRGNLPGAYVGFTSLPYQYGPCSHLPRKAAHYPLPHSFPSPYIHTGKETKEAKKERRQIGDFPSHLERRKRHNRITKTCLGLRIAFCLYMDNCG